jgi:hypothetical protein
LFESKTVNKFGINIMKIFLTKTNLRKSILTTQVFQYSGYPFY